MNLNPCLECKGHGVLRVGEPYVTCDGDADVDTRECDECAGTGRQPCAECDTRDVDVHPVNGRLLCLECEKDILLAAFDEAGEDMRREALIAYANAPVVRFTGPTFYSVAKHCLYVSREAS